MKDSIPRDEPLSELMTAIDSFFHDSHSIFFLVLFYNEQTVICGKLWFIGRQLFYHQNNNVCCHITVLRLVLVKSRMWDTQLMTCILKLLFWLCTCKKTFVTIYSQRLLCIYVIKINILHYIILFKYNMKYLFHTFFLFCSIYNNNNNNNNNNSVLSLNRYICSVSTVSQ